MSFIKKYKFIILSFIFCYIGYFGVIFPIILDTIITWPSFFVICSSMGMLLILLIAFAGIALILGKSMEELFK